MRTEAWILSSKLGTDLTTAVHEHVRTDTELECCGLCGEEVLYSTFVPLVRPGMHVAFEVCDGGSSLALWDADDGYRFIGYAPPSCDVRRDDACSMMCDDAIARTTGHAVVPNHVAAPTSLVVLPRERNASSERPPSVGSRLVFRNAREQLVMPCAFTRIIDERDGPSVVLCAQCVQKRTRMRSAVRTWRAVTFRRSLASEV
jgi:hypothetical protein